VKSVKKFEERERDEKSKKNLGCLGFFVCLFANKNLKTQTLLSQLFFPERERERERGFTILK